MSTSGLIEQRGWPTDLHHAYFSPATVSNNTFYQLSLAMEAIDDDETIEVRRLPGSHGTILNCFQKHLISLSIDQKWVKSLRSITNGFITKNDNHVKFFGGHFLGVYQIRWTDQDRETWYDDILQTDDIALEDDLHSLKAINTDWVVSSDTYNLSCLYLVHAIHTSKLPESLKHAAKIDVLLNLHFKLLTSLLARRFKYASDRETEMAAFNDLTKRYALKQYGTWLALLRARCEDIIGPRGIHRKTIETFRDDAGIISMINDIQTRLRDMVNRLTSSLYDALASNAKITSVSNVMTVDGEAIVKDVTRELTKYKRYIHTVISDKNSFVRPELVSIVADAIHTLSVPRFVVTLGHMSECYGTSQLPWLPQFLDEVLIHAFDYIKSNRLRTTDLQLIITRMKGLYMAAKMSDPAMLQLKEMAAAIVASHGKERSPALAASERTAVILYVLIRTLVANHYAT